MEHVVLPTLAEFEGQRVMILDWVDDLVVAADTAERLADITLALLRRIHALGGRLSLAKCKSKSKSKRGSRILTPN